MENLRATFQKATDSKKVPGIAAIALDRSGKALFEGGFGTTNLGDEKATKVTLDTQFFIFSCTKLVTSIAALQLVEQGKLSPDDLVEKYMPEIKEVGILEGFDDNDQPIVRDVKTKTTILHLMTHTGGFTYDFLDENDAKWRKVSGYSELFKHGTIKAYMCPRKFEPGTQYTYGMNIDWLGLVVEKISGKKLEQYIEDHITGPLGMKRTTAVLLDVDDYGVCHMRLPDGNFFPATDFKHPTELDIRGGGHFLHSTANDFSTLLLTLINEGAHPQSKVRILKPETVSDYVYKDLIPASVDKSIVGVMNSVSPMVSNSGEMLPEVKKSWSGALMLNIEDVPGGRKAGSGSWAGINNCYYWVDPNAGKLGLVLSAILPFCDSEVVDLYEDLENYAYGAKEVNATHTHFKVAEGKK